MGVLLMYLVVWLVCEVIIIVDSMITLRRETKERNKKIGLYFKGAYVIDCHYGEEYYSCSLDIILEKVLAHKARLW